MPDQQWGPPPGGPYPPQGTPGGGGQYPPPGPPQQGYPGPPYQQGFPQQQYPQQQYPQQQGGHPYQQPAGYQPPNVGWNPQFGPPGGRAPGFGGPPGRPPKKSGRTAVGATLAGIGGIIVLVVVVFAAAALKGESSVTTEPSPVASYPTPPSPQPTMTPPPLPTAKPTAPKPTATRTTQKPPPPRRKPPKPQPTNRQIMTADPFYRTGPMPAAGCRLPDVALSNKAGTQVYYGAILRCLDRSWPHNVSAGRDRFRKPRMLMVAGYVDSPCGGSAMPRSYYCGVNEVIYMRYDQDIKQYNTYPAYYSKVYSRMWALFTVAHEFGHHVQKMTGILDAYDNVRWSGAVSRTVGLEMNRRMELQASCLGNVFVGANRRTMPMRGQNALQFDWAISHTIDTTHDHGDADSHTFWSHRGYRSHNPSQCNTFTASSNRVR